MSWDLRRNLVGRKVSSVHYDKRHDAVVFVLDDDSRQAYVAEGDCCSVSWIEHVSGAAQLIGTVKEVEEIDLPDAVPSPKEDVDVEAIYGIKIHTDKGYGLIELRNSSNGYYGGYLALKRWEAELPPKLEDF